MSTICLHLLTFHNACRNISCYPGKVSNGSHCLPYLSMYTDLRYRLAIDITGEITLNSNSSNTTYVFPNVVRQIEHSLYGYLQPEIYMSNTTVYSDLDSGVGWYGATSMKISSIYIVVNRSCDKIFSFHTEEFVRFQACLTISAFGKRNDIDSKLVHIAEYSFKSISNLNNFTFSIQHNVSALNIQRKQENILSKKSCALDYHVESSLRTQYIRTQFVSNLLMCKIVVLEPSEFEASNQDMYITLLRTTERLVYGQFELTEDGKARVCIEHLENFLSYHKQKNISIYDTINSYLTLACFIVSLPSILLTFLVYLVVQKLRTTPGINNMSLCFSLFFAQLMLLISGFMQRGLWCNITGICLHYFWLSAFLAMNVCSFHMYRLFSGFMGVQRDNNNKQIVQYHLYSYGVSFLIVSVNILISVITSDTIGYGKASCFIDNIISRICSFILPIGLVCIFNIVFFLITLLKIRATPKVESSKENRHHVSIYLRLFTLTGITWLLVMVESNFSSSVLTICITILNGLQGLFIFVSYVCNKRVIAQLRYRLMNSNQSISSHTNQSELTTPGNTVSRSSAGNTPLHTRHKTNTQKHNDINIENDMHSPNHISTIL